MIKILILYDSATGNTKKMAEFVAEGAAINNVAEVRLISVEEASKEDIIWCDGIAVGSPTNMGIVSWRMKKFWDELGTDLWGKIEGKVGSAFSSSGGWGGGAEITCMSILTILLNYGFFVFGTTDYVDSQFTLHYGAVNAGSPNDDKAIKACRKLGEKLVFMTGKIFNREELLIKEKNKN